MRVLVVEDDKRLAATVKRGLEHEGYAVDVALDGVEGKWLAMEQAYDAIVLDIMLPDGSGIDYCRELYDSTRTPVIMVTARSSEVDVVLGLEIGAADLRVGRERRGARVDRGQADRARDRHRCERPRRAHRRLSVRTVPSRGARRAPGRRR